MSATRCTKRQGRRKFLREGVGYEVAPKHQRIWITVGPFSVLLNRTHEGLIVDVWEKNQEDGDSLDTLSLMDPQPEDETP